MNPDISGLLDYLDEPSRIGDHKEDCCSDAKSFLIARHSFHRQFRESGLPTGLHNFFAWGPNNWPIYWCDVPNRALLDCGALAEVAKLVLEAQGTVVLPAQVIIRYPEIQATHWRRMWEDAQASSDWVTREACYHEACGVVKGQAVEIWDPTDRVWIEPRRFGSKALGGVLAVRIFGSLPRRLKSIAWGNIRMSPGRWTVADSKGV